VSGRPVLMRSHSPMDVSTASLGDVLFKTPNVFACGFTRRLGLNDVGREGRCARKQQS
jgi:hypothetical protein